MCCVGVGAALHWKLGSCPASFRRLMSPLPPVRPGTQSSSCLHARGWPSYSATSPTSPRSRWVSPWASAEAPFRRPWLTPGAPSNGFWPTTKPQWRSAVPDLRTIVDGLLAQPLTATPPLEHVVERARALRQRRRRQLTAATLAAFALLASVAVAFERELGRENVRLVGEADVTTTTSLPIVVGGSADDLPPIPGVTDAPPRSSTSTTTRPASGSSPGVGGSAGNGSCAAAGANPAWDTGVSADRIELVTERKQGLTGSTAASNGHIGVTAVVNRVNREGGICGRLLHLRLADQPSPQTPAFAVVGPALGAKVGELDAAGVPVVGGLGLGQAQYASEWAWPVGPSMAGMARSMAKHAWDAGARTFGLVYENYDAWTLEGARAFRVHVRDLGGTVDDGVG